MTPEPKLLTPEEITEIAPSHKGVQTTLKLFRQGVLYVHDRGGKTGRQILSYDYSVRARLAATRILRRDGTVTLADIGAAMRKIEGNHDAFIAERFRNGLTTEQIADELAEAVRKLL